MDVPTRRLPRRQVRRHNKANEALREALMQELDSPTTEEEEIASLLGCEISEVALFAAQVLRRTGAYSVLCPGCGRGECSAYLARSGFSVTAYDSSERTIQCVETTAQRVGVSIEAFVDDVVIPHRRLRKFDAIFSHNMLHQMRSAQRRALLRSYHRSLRQGGVLVLSVLSSDDERYGYGRQVEEDTYEFAMGECLHFYTPHELQDELSRLFEVARVEEMQEVQVHCGTGQQSYRLLVATALKVRE
jgi:2-polyprenyl-3-methyl-5-hydroxy-6-metoxy-1,4-benzoquinol methylase